MHNSFAVTSQCRGNWLLHQPWSSWFTISTTLESPPQHGRPSFLTCSWSVDAGAIIWFIPSRMLPDRGSLMIARTAGTQVRSSWYWQRCSDLFSVLGTENSHVSLAIDLLSVASVQNKRASFNKTTCSLLRVSRITEQALTKPPVLCCGCRE